MCSFGSFTRLMLRQFGGSGLCVGDYRKLLGSGEGVMESRPLSSISLGTHPSTTPLGQTPSPDPAHSRAVHLKTRQVPMEWARVKGRVLTGSTPPDLPQQMWAVSTTVSLSAPETRG